MPVTSAFGVLHLALAAFAEELAHGFDQVGAAAREAGLSRGDLSAAGVQRQVAVEGEVMLADEVAALAMLAEAEHFHLQHDGDDEVVVGMEGADVRRRHAGLRECALAGDEVPGLGHIDDGFVGAIVGALAIADRDDDLRRAPCARRSCGW